MPDPNLVANLLYRNVTVSGLPGTGSSTLAKGLAKTLGWEYFCGGDFLRQYAIDKGLFNPRDTKHHDQSIFDDQVDRDVENLMRTSMQTKQGQVVESWLSGFNAQGIEGVLKVLVVCSEDAVRVDRLVNRDNITVEEAKKHIFEREQKNLTKWQRLYQEQWQKRVVGKGKASSDKPIYFWYPQLYDLVLDTYSLNQQETLNLTLEKLGFS